MQEPKNHLESEDQVFGLSGKKRIYINSWIFKNFVSKKIFFIFVVVFIFSLGLRLLFLSHGEITGDEPFYAVRSIGMVDVMLSAEQETPFHWFDELPWWANFSFHDHPPLVFFIQHIFFQFFGDSIFIARLPSALFGAFSVILIFFIGKKIFDEKIGLLAMILMAFNGVAGFFSRIALMESIVLFFVLLSFYLFLLVLQDKKFLPLFGIACGLGILAKYIAIIFFFPYLIILLMFRPRYFRDFRFYLALLLIILVFSPVIIYNIEIYKNVGHFDLQFSYLLGQDVPEWTNAIGKIQRGELSDRVARLDTLLFMNSIQFFFMSSLGFLALLWYSRKGKLLSSTLILTFLISLLSLLFIDTQVRFLFYLSPFFVLFAAYIFSFLLNSDKRLFKFFMVLLLVGEFIFFVNINFLSMFNKQKGLRYINRPAKEYFGVDYGINELNKYLDSELRGFYSLMPDSSYYVKSLEKKLKSYALDKKNKQGRKVILVHDMRMNSVPFEWTFTRLSLYHSWPFMSITYLMSNLDSIESTEYNDSEFYFVYTTPNTLRANTQYFYGEIVRKLMQINKINPEKIIYTKDGRIAYEVYRTNLSDMKRLLNTNPK